MKERDVKRLKTALSALDGLSNARDPLDRLDHARRAREAIEHLEQLCVDDARANGRTWTEIGELYGMTKQGAQQRFSVTGKDRRRPHKK